MRKGNLFFTAWGVSSASTTLPIAAMSGWFLSVPTDQNAAARLLTNTLGRDHITPVLRQLYWLPVQRRMEFKIACLVHQSLASTAPTYLSADIHLDSEHGRHLLSSSYGSLAVARTRTTFGDRSFTVAGPRLWNTLPATLIKDRSLAIYGQFRRHLKKTFIQGLENHGAL